MPQISERQNRRLFIEQSMLNNFPLESKARWYRYSIASQGVHPFGGPIHELSVAQERSWHNYFPSTYDVTDLDLIYYVPSSFVDVTIDAYIDSVQTVVPVKTEPDLDSFWYNSLPNRLKYIKNSQKQIYPTKTASQLRFGNLYDQYIAGTHIASNLFDNGTSTPWSVSSGAAAISFSTSGGYGNGSFLGVEYTSAPTATTVIGATATQIATGDSIAFYSQFLDSSLTPSTSIVVTVGYQGVGSAQSTFVADDQWQQRSVVFSPSSETSTGIPFVNITSIKNIGETSELKVSDFHFFNYSSVYSSTDLSYSMRDWTENDLSWAYVIVTGGTNLMDVDTSMTRPSMPAAVTIEGIDANGFYSHERVLIPHNGTHKSLKLWKQITGTRVDSIYPWTANVSVQLQNYQSYSGEQDSVDNYITAYHEGALFYSLLSTNGSSYLGHDSFITDDFASMVDGYDFILPRTYMELTNSIGSSIGLTDMKLDTVNRHLYCLEGTNKTLHIYDPFGHWPTQDSLRYAKNQSTPFPDMVARELDEDEIILRIGDSVGLEVDWRNRYKQLIQNRWTLLKPDGSLVGLDINGNEVSGTSNYWIANEEGTDNISGEFRFKPQNINYTATNYGDFVAVLEAQYVNEEFSEPITERDTTIFSVVNRKPLTSITIPSTDLRTPIGMDLDPNGNIRLAYTNSDNNLILDEEVFSLHYDYFFEEIENKKIYFREKYTKVKIRRRSEVACATAKNVKVINNTNTVLSASEACNGFILVLSNSSAVQVTMPPVSSSENGHHCIIKRRGGNLVTIVPDSGDTIETAASYILINDGDAENLTYIDSITDWVIS